MSNTNVVPQGYHSVQPYLMFKNCETAIIFYAKAFGATQKLCMKNPNGSISHAEIEIGDSVVMMADESPASDAFATEHYGGSPISLMIYSANCDATYQQALQAGAESLRVPTDQSYGDRMAGVRDPFGYKWWIGTPIPNASATEAAR